MKRGIKPQLKATLPYKPLSPKPPKELSPEEGAVYKLMVKDFQPDENQKDIVVRIAQLQSIYDKMHSDILATGVKVLHQNKISAYNKGIALLCTVSNHIKVLTDDLRDEHFRRQVAVQRDELSPEDKAMQELCNG